MQWPSSWRGFRMVLTYFLSYDPIEVPYYIDIYDDNIKADSAMLKKWLIENIGDEGKDWFYRTTKVSGMLFADQSRILFMEEEDAMAFKLAWR